MTMHGNPAVQKRPPTTVAAVIESLTTLGHRRARTMAKKQSNTKPRYPDIKVKLVGGDGNAFSVLGNVTRAMRKAGVEKPEIDAFMQEATSGDYDHLLFTCMTWVDAS